MIQIITRIINNNRPSLIDNVFLNSVEHETLIGNLITKISDHLPNFIFCKNLNLKSKSENRGFYRDYSNFKLDSYIYDLRKSNLDEKLNSVHGTDEQFKLFHDILISNMQKHAPLKPVSRKMHKQKLKPWITKEILKSISIKNKLYKEFLKNVFRHEPLGSKTQITFLFTNIFAIIPDFLFSVFQFSFLQFCTYIINH